MSRTKLCQKIKSISNQSIGDFIRPSGLKSRPDHDHEDVSLQRSDVPDRHPKSYFAKALKKNSATPVLQGIKKY
jgi:hypothetical protein